MTICFPTQKKKKNSKFWPNTTRDKLKYFSCYTDDQKLTQLKIVNLSISVVNLKKKNFNFQIKSIL